VTCSLLGVWQSVPYLFADLWSLLRGDPEPLLNEADHHRQQAELWS